MLILAIPVVAGLTWGSLLLTEMALPGPGAEPASAVAAGSHGKIGELADNSRDGPSCIYGRDHPEAWVSIPDLRGGTVYQETQPDPEIPPQHIWWDPADGAERIVVPAGGATALRPYAVSGPADNPTLWFTVGTQGTTPGDSRVDLYRLDLLSDVQGVVVPGIGGFEIEPLQISVSATGFLVSNADSTGSWLELYDRDGSAVDWPANPHPVSDYTMKTVYGSLSDDGVLLASVEAEDDGPWRVILRRSKSGEEITSRQLRYEIRRIVSGDASPRGFSFLVETTEGELSCISVPLPGPTVGG